MPVYKPGYNSKPTISIYDKDGSINDKELDPEIKIGAIFKIVDVERDANGQKIYVLCQTSGEIIKNNQDNVIGLVDNGYVINAWLRHRKSSKLDSFNRYKNVEIVVTNLDSIKGAPPNIESKIVPGKDQTIERLKSFEIIARYNRKESLLGRKQNLEFDILKDGSIRLYRLVDNNVEEVKIPSFVRYLKRELFRGSQVSRIYYDNVPGVPQNFQKLFRNQRAIDIQFLMSHPDEIVSTEQMFYWSNNLETVRLKGFTWRNLKTAESMFNLCRYLCQVDLGDLQTTNNLEDITQMFQECVQLRDAQFIQNMNVSKVLKAEGLFKACGMLNSVDIQKFNFSSLIQADDMFKECRNLQDVKLCKNFDKLIQCKQMFERCIQLQSISLSGFNFRSLRDCSRMFYRSQIESADLSNINFKNLQVCSGMFQDCVLLKSINLQKTYMPEIWNMQLMFNGCKALKEVKFEPQKMSKLEDLGHTFAGCLELQQLNLQDLVYPQLKCVDRLAYEARKLKELRFNTQATNLKYILGMVNHSRVERVYLPGIEYETLDKIEDIEDSTDIECNINVYSLSDKDKQNKIELTRYKTCIILTMIGYGPAGSTYIPNFIFKDYVVYRKDILKSLGYDMG